MYAGIDQAQAWHSEQLCSPVLEQFVLPLLDVVYAKPRQPIQCSTKSHRVGDVASACLEAGRRLVERRALVRYVLDHVASALPRRHRLQEVGFAVDGADPRGAKHLVTREDVEVTVQRLNVNRHV